MELVIVIGQASPSALRDATGAVPGDRGPAQGAALAVAALAELTGLPFETFGYEFEAYRSELAAPAPCLRTAISAAIDC